MLVPCAHKHRINAYILAASAGLAILFTALSDYLPAARKMPRL
jgi:hypothetical protein